MSINFRDKANLDNTLNLPQARLFDKVYITKWLRGLSVLVLLVLPFQKLPSMLLGYAVEGDPGLGISGPPLPFWLRSVGYIDEMSLIIFFGIAVTFFLMKPSSFRLPKIALTKWLLAFVVYGFLLAGVKGIPWTQATFGIYDRMKNIAVLYLFFSIKFDREEFFKALRSLIIIGFILALFGVAAEILALTTGWGIGWFVNAEQRLGLYRVLSLTGLGNQVYLGTYAILILFLGHVIIKNRPLRLIQDVFLFLLTLLTFSKQAWLACATVMSLFSRRMLIVSLLLISGMILLFVSNPDTSMDPEKFFRLFCFWESLKILQSHPLTGLGPGMFGGLASVMWQSPVYDSWPVYFKNFAYGISGIDMFWPSVWGEFGILGAIIYFSAFGSIFILLGKTTKSFLMKDDLLLFRVGNVLQYFMAAIIIMGMAGGLNAAFILYTYFALVGIYLSLDDRRSLGGEKVAV